MSAAPSRRFPLGPLALALVAACSHATTAGQGDVIVTPDGRRVITENAIERSGAPVAVR